MVKSVLGVKHQGLTDWKIQRLTAVFMGFYLVFFVCYLMRHPGITFMEWHVLFAYKSMKIASVLLLASVLYHAWIGMWTVYTDYIKNTIIRAVIDTLTLLMLFACLTWGIMILWSFN